ncbi:MAG: poly(3-hydroxyalkanoate) polymerase [Marmoricola sp.]|nr:poly(3-hydroxyalkanoate) polymerase [Marmoricola sp.]
MSTAHAYETDNQDVAVALDSLLASVGRVAQPGVVPGPVLATWIGALARHPRTTAYRVAGLAGDLAKIVAGVSDAAPSTRDKRFADPAWSGNPLLRRSVQGYLALSEKAMQLVDDAELDERTAQRVRLLVENLVGALSPSNSPLLNPSALKETIDTGGANVVRGLKALVKDLSSHPRVPAMVDNSSFQVGRNLGATPGAVVLRTPVLELIQYTPTTETVHEIPLLLVPPTINKFYVLDLAPGRSTVEYLVDQGQQVFAISWRNPGAQHASWGLDTYIHGVIEALDAVCETTGTDRAALYGACSGGIISSMAAAHLAGTGRNDRLASLTLAVTVLDQTKAGTASALVDRKRADAAIALSKRAGYLDGSLLAEVFAWLRPNDLIWNYWVNNYLLGKKPPAFDILSWNADTTRMPAKLHEDFLELALANKLTAPGEATALGVPVDLSRVTADAYIIGGETDHLTPWQSCYRTTALLGGKSEFVLSTSGHIAALVNPPTNTKSSFRHSSDTPVNPRDFAASAETHQGSWWSHYAAWLGARSGEQVPAPTELGRGRFQPVAAAPGTYVFDK